MRQDHAPLEDGTAPLWVPAPARCADARLTAFRKVTGHRDYASLHRWSVEEPEAFWSAVWDFTGVIAETRGVRAMLRGESFRETRFFPDARLNYARNLLRRHDDTLAIIHRGERGRRRTLTWRQLAEEVARLAAAMRRAGVGVGDRVAALLPNAPEAVAAMLATASIGAVWSSCSPDFGVGGIVDRFGQIEPRLLFTVDGFEYGGRGFDCSDKVMAVLERIPSLETVVSVASGAGRTLSGRDPRIVDYAAFRDAAPAEELAFAMLPFDHPLFILYSSGTTGAPKCIVHGAGGTLLQHLKEHQLHSDIRPGDVVFYASTTSWMMWNWLVSALASEATIVLHDGAPNVPSLAFLFDCAQEERFTFFGTSAKFIDACRKEGIAPARTHDLASLRTLASTGSPLVAESFDYVYASIKSDLHVASISGGTDIISCFVLGDPTAPVWRGEIQAPGLGMSIEIRDENGRAVRGVAGELTCTRPFPCMPVKFWNDPDGEKYRNAYFARDPAVWTHGDWSLVTEHGGVVIFGRSDAVLKPGGVRIGTAEIYRQVEQVEEVLESLAIGLDRDGDTRIVLFVRLRPGIELAPALERRIRDRIRDNTSRAHVPWKILAVSDIPRTKSGKIVELAVRDVVNGRPIRNTEALANPEALDQFRGLAALA